MSVSNRLSRVRAQLEDAQAEFHAAFRADGFNPVRAEKAQKWLDAAKAALVSAIAGEQGELSRERALGNLERRLAGAQRALRAVEFNLRRALKDVAGVTVTQLDDVERRLVSLRASLEADLRKNGLKPSNRERLQRNRSLIVEAQYRLDEVKKVCDQVAAIETDIKGLKASRAAA